MEGSSGSLSRKQLLWPDCFRFLTGTRFFLEVKVPKRRLLVAMVSISLIQCPLFNLQLFWILSTSQFLIPLCWILWLLVSGVIYQFTCVLILHVTLAGEQAQGAGRDPSCIPFAYNMVRWMYWNPIPHASDSIARIKVRKLLFSLIGL